MTIHLIVCPTCSDSQEVDLLPGQRATLRHTERGHIMRVMPRVMPILTPERSERPKSDQSRERPKDAMQPHVFGPRPFDQPDLNRGD